MFTTTDFGTVTSVNLMSEYLMKPTSEEMIYFIAYLRTEGVKHK